MALEIPQRIGIVRIGCKFAKAQEVSVTRSAFNLKAGEADAIGHLPYGANPGLEKFLAVLLILRSVVISSGVRLRISIQKRGLASMTVANS